MKWHTNVSDPIDMGRVKIRAHAVKARAKREDTIKKALDTIRAGTMSLRDAQSAGCSTLQGRMEGAKPHFVAHVAQQKLTPADEKAVVRLITRLESCGFPPRIEHVIQAAECILWWGASDNPGLKSTSCTGHQINKPRRAR